VDFLRRKCGTCPLQGPNHNPRLSRFVLFLLVNGILSQEEGRHWVETRWRRYDGIRSNYIERRVALLCLVRPQFLTAAEPAIQTQKSNRRYRKTLGIRRGEIVTFCAGSGIGKSQICREIAYHLLLQGETVGYVALEEAVKRSALGFMSLAINQPLHLSDQEIDAEQFKSAFDDTLGTQRVFFLVEPVCLA